MSRTIKLRNRSSKRRYRLSKRRYTRKKTARKYKVKKPKHKRRTRKITRRKYKGGGLLWGESVAGKLGRNRYKAAGLGNFKIALGLGALYDEEFIQRFLVRKTVNVASWSMVSPVLLMGVISSAPWSAPAAAATATGLAMGQWYSLWLAKNAEESRFTQNERILWKICYGYLLNLCINNSGDNIGEIGVASRRTLEKYWDNDDNFEETINRIVYGKVAEGLSEEKARLSEQLKQVKKILLVCCLLSEILIKHNISPHQFVRKSLDVGNTVDVDGGAVKSLFASKFLRWAMNTGEHVFNKLNNNKNIIKNFLKVFISKCGEKRQTTINRWILPKNIPLTLNNTSDHFARDPKKYDELLEKMITDFEDEFQFSKEIRDAINKTAQEIIDES